MPKLCTAPTHNLALECQNVSRLTAFTIYSNKVACTAGQHESGKWVGWISLPDKYWRPLINTEPRYDSKEEAVYAMEKLVADLRHFLDKEQHDGYQ